MPDPIPVVVLARLAIAGDQQGRGLGRALFQDAANRVIHAADAIGIRGLFVHAISEEAKAFYVRLGLDPSALETMTLMTTVAALKATLRREVAVPANIVKRAMAAGTGAGVDRPAH